jgi:alpha-2-macroglobulin-like protein
LAANALFLAGDKEAAHQVMDQLANLQDKDGHVRGAITTVVGSGGDSLEIETTSLATLAWLRDPAYAANVEQSIRYLAEACKGGRYGSTQSTVLALRAIVAYDKARAHPTAAGKVQLFVDDKGVGDAMAFDANTTGAIKLPDFADKLAPGQHSVELRMTDGSDLPYAVDVSFNSVTPSSSDQCKLSMTASLADEKVSEGAATEARVTVTNRGADTLPTPIAIVGLPGGLEVRHDQLKELVKSGRIAAYEVRGREVILYWRDIQPNQRIEVPLSLTAAIPGEYTGPASRVYLYYTDEFKQWLPGMKVTVTPK